MIARGLPVAIVAGIPEELAGVRRALDEARAMSFGGNRVWCGLLGGREVLLAVAGDGPVRARLTVDALLAARRCGALVGIGVAGGLTPGLLPETLIVASECLADGPTVLAAHPGLMEAAVAAGAVPAVVVGASRVVASIDGKVALAALCPGRRAVVDLESNSWALGASSQRVPWAILRVVSDAWNEELPGFLNRCHRGDGSLDRGRIAAHALVAPLEIPGLLRLRARVARAAVTLAGAVGGMMGSLGRETSDPAFREAM